ncbi:ribosome maturation factor RimM [Candidatus Deianiraea vastatrix]|uniref:Ribosome maturation factor RimM n=1 Tax=Candidatus Deianiraea vastatrix TaxID=2163644 RepID=A0A5B8XDH2_9RICK|nr:ribosome maturation factor RimM [Candidatus Deianiraea vastatrix]QED23290.1 Ribosome maturation factor RimM [Candidatus Deianiraea vastatrix]
MTKLVKIGTIISAFGIKGQVKIYSEVNDLDQFSKLTKFANGDIFELKSCKKHKNDIWISQIEGFASRNDIEKLVKTEIFCYQSDFPKLKNNEFYEFEVIGYDIVENSVKIGKLVEFLHFKSTKMLKIELCDKNFSRGNIDKNGFLFVDSRDIISIKEGIINIQNIKNIITVS